MQESFHIPDEYYLILPLNISSQEVQLLSGFIKKTKR